MQFDWKQQLHCVIVSSPRIDRLNPVLRIRTLRQIVHSRGTLNYAAEDTAVFPNTDDEICSLSGTDLITNLGNQCDNIHWSQSCGKYIKK